MEPHGGPSPPTEPRESRDTKRPRARTDMDTVAADRKGVPNSEMGDSPRSSMNGSVGSARGGARTRNGWTSRQPPTRRAGKRFNDKSAILDVADDPIHHHWMQMMTQAVHQTLGQQRKANGQAFDTWIILANHSLATTMMRMADGHLEMAIAARHDREQARRDSRDMPPLLPNPAADFTARFVLELKKHDLGQSSKAALDLIWADINKHPNLEEDVSYFNVSKVSDGEETRIVIGMKGWAMRPKIMDVMRQFGSEVRYSSGGAPPGYMERQLGEYCRELKEWEER